MNAETTLIAREQLRPGHRIPGIGTGEFHEFDHFEALPTPVYNPDPERAIATQVAVCRDGLRITIGSPMVAVLTNEDTQEL